MATFEISFEESNEEYIKQLMEIRSYDSVLDDTGELCLKIWKDAGVQEAWKRRSEIQVLDNAEYFMLNIERLTKPDLTPTYDDVIRCRAKTTGERQAKKKHALLKKINKNRNNP